MALDLLHDKALEGYDIIALKKDEHHNLTIPSPSHREAYFDSSDGNFKDHAVKYIDLDVRTTGGGELHYMHYNCIVTWNHMEYLNLYNAMNSTSIHPDNFNFDHFESSYNPNQDQFLKADTSILQKNSYSEYETKGNLRMLIPRMWYHTVEGTTSLLRSKIKMHDIGKYYNGADFVYFLLFPTYHSTTLNTNKEIILMISRKHVEIKYNAGDTPFENAVKVGARKKYFTRKRPYTWRL